MRCQALSAGVGPRMRPWVGFLRSKPGNEAPQLRRPYAIPVTVAYTGREASIAEVFIVAQGAVESLPDDSVVFLSFAVD